MVVIDICSVEDVGSRCGFFCWFGRNSGSEVGRLKGGWFGVV